MKLKNSQSNFLIPEKFYDSVSKDGIGVVYSLLGILAISFAGCANPYSQNYQSLLHRPQTGSFLMQTSIALKPKIVTSTNMEADSLSMLENGYLLIGRAAFRSPPIDETQAIDHAQKVGAEIVLTKKEYVNTVTESVPITEWLPDQQTTVTEMSTFQTSPTAAPSIARRQITQTVQGEAYIQYVPQNVEYYNYSATFWKKIKPMKFGVFVQQLDNETKKRLQTNRGVIVKAVVRKTPAFNADILNGDIIVLFNNEPIADPEDFFAKIKANAGQEVTVKIIRDGTTRDITLTLIAAIQ